MQIFENYLGGQEIPGWKAECDKTLSFYYKCTKQHLWRGWGRRHWPKWVWEWMEIISPKAIRTVYKHCTFIDQVVSHSGMG